MNKAIPCSLVKDIIPLDMEHLTSDDSNKLIREHIKECDECNEYYNRLIQDLVDKSEEKEGKEVQEINYMKKIHAYQRSTIILGGFLSFLLGFFGPLIIITIKVVLYGELPDYYLARLAVAWKVDLMKMLICGIIAFGVYSIIIKILQKVKLH